ncbi:MAG TPA: glycosyltransferase family 4 protein [Terriglobales bacterium]|nr:glycosyltransferase family 4 protein [Terriglobales bacterium]
MEKTKALCIFTTLLGHSVEVARYRATLDRIPYLECNYVLVDSAEYRKHPAPRWARRISAWEFESVARQTARSALQGQFDILLVNVWEFAIAFAPVARHCPAAVLLDCTPASISAQVLERGVGGWRRRLVHHAHHLAFDRIANRYDYYLPKGTDCAESLHRDYKVPEERCFVRLAAHDLEYWKPIERARAAPVRLLWVGNDFVRKGGDFLLALYRAHLAGHCTLTLASNDPLLEGERLPEGVVWLKGKNRDELLPVFQQSDLFVFPSQQDFVPEAVTEALSVGLPCIVRDIPGVRDIVLPGQNGLRIPRHAPIETWAAELLPLIANPAEVARMSTNARRFAEEKLSFGPYFRLFEDVVERLCALKGRKRSWRKAPAA